MEESNLFTTSDVSFAKIVPTPTPLSWSQAYHAGKLFAVISLTKKEAPEDANQLSLLGKEILNTLEQEYFITEDKNLTSIKQAIEMACGKIPNDISSSFVIGSIIKTALYVFIFGKGKIILKRGDKIGAVLTSDLTESEHSEVISASGLLENHDTIVLQTQKFLDVVTQDVISSVLNSHNSPSEIAEAIAPKIHGQEAGDACAIIVSYMQEEPENDKEYESSPPPNQNKMISFLNKFRIIPQIFASMVRILPLQRKTEFPATGVTRSKKFFLTIAAILLIVLVASIFFAVKKQNDEKTHVLFEKTFSEAKIKYDEGQSLLSLNKNLAREDLEKAKKILIEVKPQFKKGSKEENQIEDLLKKIEEQLFIASSVNTVEPKQVDMKKSPILAYEIENKPKGVLTQDANSIYAANNKEVIAFDKKTEKTKSLFKNDSDWGALGGMGTYLTNVYLLDKKENRIHKFVPTEKEYSRINYLASGVSPDLSNSISMAIDTSVWVLLDDGAILKFTRGKQDSFTISGLEEPLSKPSRVFTNIDTDNLYVLDNGNSRIVVLKKNGDYQSQYKANILKDAQDFDVVESSKKIFVLSKEKIYEIGIK